MLKIILSEITKYIFISVFTLMYTIASLIRIFKNRNKTSTPIDLSEEPSCLADPNLGKHSSIRLKNRDVEIHYVAKGDRSKPLMLFVHGFPEFWYSWRHQLVEFGDDYYAVALDMTGYGGSSKPSEVERYHALEIAADIKEFILELGYTSCILVGHDWGGVITYTVASNFPEVVGKMIVMNAPNRHAAATKSFKQFMKSSYIFYFQTPYIPEYFLSRDNCVALDMMTKGPMRVKNDKTFTKEDLVAYKYNFLKSGFTGPLNYYRNIFKEGKAKIKHRISAPSLIVWGTDDGALNMELASISAEVIDNCDIKYIEGASHWVNQEHPKEVNKAVREFLTKE